MGGSLWGSIELSASLGSNCGKGGTCFSFRNCHNVKGDYRPFDCVAAVPVRVGELNLHEEVGPRYAYMGDIDVHSAVSHPSTEYGYHGGGCEVHVSDWG